MRLPLTFLIYFFIIFVSFFHTSSTTTAHTLHSPSQCIVNFRLPSTLSHLEGTTVHYKGNLFNCNNGWCLIPQEQECSTFSFVITPHIISVSDGNNIRYLKRDEKAACLWYDLTYIKESDRCYWAIEPKNPEEMPLRLPLHAIIIKLNPNLVCRVEETQTRKHLRSHTNVYHLPTIVIDNVTQEEWDNACVEAVLSFDSTTIHQPTKRETKQEKCCNISVPKNSLFKGSLSCPSSFSA
jgi:hypothetical protein